MGGGGGWAAVILNVYVSPKGENVTITSNPYRAQCKLELLFKITQDPSDKRKPQRQTSTFLLFGKYLYVKENLKFLTNTRKQYLWATIF